MGRQFVTMGMRMRRMFFGQDRLFDRLVFRVRLWAGNRVVPGIFQLPVPILAGSCLYRDFHIAFGFWRGLSWGHNE